MPRKDDLITIRPLKGWGSIDLHELLTYKDLLWLLSLRGIKSKYAQSVLGIGWAFVQPLVTTIVFTLVFGRLAKVSSDGIPYFLFSLCGMVPWSFFAASLTDSANSLIQNSNMISKVYFPRIILPISAAMARGLDFIIGLGLLLVVTIYKGFHPSITILFLPVLISILFIFSVGLGMMLSALAIQYRDVKHALTFGIQLLLYAAPVVYPTSNVPVEFQGVYSLNPMTGVIEGFRVIFLLHSDFPWDWVLRGGIVSVLTFGAGLLYFLRSEGKFADVS